MININLQLPQIESYKLYDEHINKIIKAFNIYSDSVNTLKDKCFNFDIFNEHEQNPFDKSLTLKMNEKISEMTGFLTDIKKATNEKNHQVFEEYAKLFKQQAQYLDGLMKSTMAIFTGNEKLLSEFKFAEDTFEQIHAPLKSRYEIKNIKFDYQKEINNGTLTIENKKQTNFEKFSEIIEVCHNQKLWVSPFIRNFESFLGMRKAVEKLKHFLPNNYDLTTILDNFDLIEKQKDDIFKLFELIEKQVNKIKDNSINIAKTYAFLMDKVYESVKDYLSKKYELKESAYTKALERSNQFGDKEQKPAKAIMQVSIVNELKNARYFKKNHQREGNHFICWNPLNYSGNDTKSVMDKFIEIELDIEEMLQKISELRQPNVHDFINVSLWQLFAQIKDHPENKKISKSAGFFDNVINCIGDNRHFAQFIGRWLKLTFHSYSIAFIADGNKPPILLCDFEKKLNNLKYFLNLPFKENEEELTEAEEKQLSKFKIGLRNFVMLDEDSIKKSHKENNEKMSHKKEIGDQNTKILNSEQQKDKQLGWNCFDVAIGLVDRLKIKNNENFSEQAKTAREILVKLALLKKEDIGLRKLLSIEIKHAALIPANQPDSLPKCMVNKKLKEIVKKYQDAPKKQKYIDSFQNCNNSLGHKNGNRLSMDDLKKFFKVLENKNQYSKAYEQYKEAKKIIDKAESQLNEYCQSKDVYEQYLANYYGKNAWFAFQRGFVGEHTTSMVDITARLLNIKIVIHENDEKKSEIYRTKNDNALEEVHIIYRNGDHFEQYAVNPVLLNEKGQTFDNKKFTENEKIQHLKIIIDQGEKFKPEIKDKLRSSESLPSLEKIEDKQDQKPMKQLSEGSIKMIEESKKPIIKTDSAPGINNHKNPKKPIHKKRPKSSTSKNPQSTHQQNDDFLQSKTTDQRSRSHSSPSQVEIRHHAHKSKKTTDKRRSKSHSDKNRNQENKPLKTFQPKDDNETTENRSSFASILIKLNNKPTKQDHLEGLQDKKSKIQTIINPK